MDIFAESCRRAIQSAIGVSNPMLARRGTQPLSGVAQDKFREQEELSNFHFVDNFERAIALEGKILDDLIAVTYDTAREIAIADEHDEESRNVMVNDPESIDEETGEPSNMSTDVGNHDITVSAGPNTDSLMQEASATADALIQNPQLIQMALAQPGGTAAKLLSMAIKMKELGPIGDQIAEIIAPEKDQAIPPQVQAAVQQMQQQLEQAQAMIGHLQQELKEKTEMRKMEIDSDERMNARDNETKIEIEQLKLGVQNLTTELELRLKAIDMQWAKMHESELAPNPAEGPMGIHPDTPPAPEEINGAE
jgi:hypothetical protein